MERRTLLQRVASPNVHHSAATITATSMSHTTLPTNITLPGDKVVLRVISEVCKQVLESYQNNRFFTTGKPGSDQLTFKIDSDFLVDEEATTTANKLTLEEYLLRWGNRLKLQNMSSLFSIKENIITCLMKQSNSAISCNGNDLNIPSPHQLEFVIVQVHNPSIKNIQQEITVNMDSSVSTCMIESDVLQQQTAETPSGETSTNASSSFMYLSSFDGSQKQTETASTSFTHPAGGAQEERGEEVPSTSTLKSNWNSREFRRQRTLLKASCAAAQSRIPHYFEILKDIEDFTERQENDSLRLQLKNLEDKYSLLQSFQGQQFEVGLPGQSLLKRMMQQSITQNGKSPNKIRHNDAVLEHFCLNVWILGGRRLYEIFYANFPGIFPSPTTIHQKLVKFDISVDEDCLNVSKVKEYLVSNGAPLIICLSEDATGVVGRVEYYAKKNCLMGFSNPLTSNGFPDSTASNARTAQDILNQFDHHDRASVVMIGMIQPIVVGLPAIRLFAYGRKQQVYGRFKRNEGDTEPMASRGFSVSCFSTPQSELPAAIPVNALYLRKRDCIPVQDTIHLGAKLQTRFWKTQNILPSGNKIASPAHIINLIKNIGVTKDKHGLRDRDLELIDKMNYDAVTRLCNPRLTELLGIVSGSEATRFYLNLMNKVTSSFLDKKLEPLERVYRLWYCVFCLRYWRYLLSCDDVYPLAKHFITLNAYLCIEINAHSLPCESYFKAARSFTPVGSSQLTFTLQDFLYNRCRKIDVQLRLISSSKSDGIRLPRIEKTLIALGGAARVIFVNLFRPLKK
ncbi:hypothetical protein OUZ56_003310 [Daphnia magna]|uniref:Uncharacterized protein n=1 Tax=Daphnia magna TaxID=35525 RepID=A0ABR0A8C6_9CRUS|nr:hypothetical protein OUZ56_003310 [Daphnia magna]